MTWSELKKAVEDTEISEDDEVCLIECRHGEGDKTLHVMRLGRAFKLTENPSDGDKEYRGCAT